MTAFSISKTIARTVFVAAAISLAAPGFAADSGGDSSSPPAISEVRAVLKDGNYSRAITMLNDILQENANNADALNLMGYSLRKSGNWKRGEAFYIRALKISPNHRGANEYLGELYVETGRIALAKERLAVLEKVCGTGCEEYKDLAAVIGKAN